MAIDTPTQNVPLINKFPNEGDSRDPTRGREKGDKRERRLQISHPKVEGEPTDGADAACGASSEGRVTRLVFGPLPEHKCTRSQSPVKADVGCCSSGEEVRGSGVGRLIAGKCLHSGAHRRSERVERVSTLEDSSNRRAGPLS